MALKSIPLKKTYSSDFDDILHEFYIPALKESVEYNRLAGFFSSTCLAIAARGILGLIRNGGSMKLIVSPKLNKDDLKTILNAYEHPEKYIEKKMLEELENFDDGFIRDHIFALGWMIANKKLEIKIAIVHNDKGVPLTCEEIQNSGIFHQKIGILKDLEGNIISFSGSVNETAIGWLENMEEFKVFRSWVLSEDDYVRDDVSKFNRFWHNRSRKTRTMDIPQAVKKKLIEIAPQDIERIDLEKWYKIAKMKKGVKLFRHQKNAVNAWLENNMRGIFEMATGTGKTFTALSCLEQVLKIGQRLLVIITCPYQHLVQQWKREIDKFGIDSDALLIADSSNPSWKDKLPDTMVDLDLGHKNRAIVLTTHSTFSSDTFVRIIQNGKGNFDIFLIGDEVHGIGAVKRKTGLIEEYTLRLGLSATPKRWFDTTGTNTIYAYFGDIVYKFSLKQAINTINPSTGQTYLTPYRYIPRFVSLTNEKLEEYLNKTRAIAMGYSRAKSDDKKDKIMENLLFKRADIVKNAIRKYEILENLLDKIGQSIEYTIIYCTPQQIDKVMDIINKRGIIAHRFTMEEGTVPQRKYDGLSQRDYILKKFAEKEYQVLVAMRCLDEGVDVPQARTAILMASSGNPREYIQRIGRVLRRYPGKNEAIIYDIVVIPSFSDLPPELKDMERKIFGKEIKRYEEIAQIAINNAEALKVIYDIKERLWR